MIMLRLLKDWGGWGIPTVCITDAFHPKVYSLGL